MLLFLFRSVEEGIMKKTAAMRWATATTIALTAGLLGCDKGGGGNDVAITATITLDLVSQTLTSVQTTEPLCVSSAPASGGSSVSKARPAAPAMQLSASVAATVPVAPDATGFVNEGTYYGTCAEAPGDLTITKASHEHGVTTLAVTFNSYCTLGTDGGKSIVNGNATYVEHGTPSDAGPIVDKQTGATDGAGLHLERFGADGTSKVADKTIVLDDYTMTYGTSYNYFYGRIPPSEGAPNKADIGKLVITDNLHNVVTTLNNVSASIYETIPGSDVTDRVLTVTKGAASIGDSGTASVKTDDGAPLVIDSTHRLSSGSFTMTGASGSATFTVNGANTLSITVDGTPLVSGTALDCSLFNFDDLFFGQ
jgi:hypothetical protein